MRSETVMLKFLLLFRYFSIIALKCRKAHSFIEAILPICYNRAVTVNKCTA